MRLTICSLTGFEGLVSGYATLFTVKYLLQFINPVVRFIIPQEHDNVNSLQRFVDDSTFSCFPY